MVLDLVLGWLVNEYFRLETSGLKDIPSSGPVMFVANHSGAWGLDGAVLYTVLSRELGRSACVQTSPLVFRLPISGPYARESGFSGGDPALGLQELRAGGLVALFPEGVAGVGKPFRQRYRLQPFGPGFAVAAMQANAPVVPVSIIGAEEALPKFGEVRFLAGIFGLPYVPVTSLLPLPSKWLVTFGAPLRPPERAASFAERSEQARQFANRVQNVVQDMVNRERCRRRTPFW